MANTYRILTIVNVILLMIAIISTLIYLVSIILVRRFHTAGNILTGNVCLTSIVCSLFWIIFNVISGFYPMLMIQPAFLFIFSSYFQVLFSCLLVYSIAMVTINRFLTIKYQNKRFFKKQAWPFSSSIVQWIVAIIVPLPLFAFSYQVSPS